MAMIMYLYIIKYKKSDGAFLHNYGGYGEKNLHSNSLVSKDINMKP